MTVEIFGTDELHAWFLDLLAEGQEAVINVVTKLELTGVALGRPHTGHLDGTKEPLRWLRSKQCRSPHRIVYAFDAKRNWAFDAKRNSAAYSTANGDGRHGTDCRGRG